MSMGQQRDTYSGPMVDGKIVPEPVEDAFRAGRQAKIPYMVGANNREFGFFTPPPPMVDGMLARFGADKDKVLAAYDPAGTGDKGEVGVGLSSDGAMVEPARMLARLTAAAGQPTYVYRFSYVASSLRAHDEGRAPRDRDPVRVRDRARQVRRRHDGRGRGARGAGERLLGRVREERRPERRGPAEVAGLHGRGRRGDGPRGRRVQGRARSLEGAARLRRARRHRRPPPPPAR